MKKKKILYVDMDNVLVDFQTGIDQLDEVILEEFDERMDEVPGIFGKMMPMKDVIESFPDWKSVKNYLLDKQIATNDENI